MAIKAKDAIRIARALIGTPYSELDCINLIKKVIRTAPGGVKDYTTAGTNSLWNSLGMSAKYRDLTWRQDGIAGAQAGMLAFKRYGAEAYDHVGIVTGEGTILHSSSVNGRGVVETPLTAQEGWDALAIHRYIEVSDTQEKEETPMKTAIINTQSSALNVREWPRTGTILGKVPKGRTVEVLEDSGDGWPRIRYNELEGYVSEEYLLIGEDDPDEETGIAEEEYPGIPLGQTTVLVGELGQIVTLVGKWRVAED